MGYNSVVLVLNDGLNEISQDKEFGRKLALNIKRQHKSTISAVDADGNIFINAAAYISTGNADAYQLISVRGNQGHNLWEKFTETDLRDIKHLLDHHNYTVRKDIRAKKRKIRESDLG